MEKIFNEVKEIQTNQKHLENAKKMCQEYSEAMYDYPEDEDGLIGENVSLRHFVDQIPKDKMNRFQGHGIARFDIEDQLAAAMFIAENGLLAGDIGKFDSSYINAYKDGNFLVLSQPDESLMIVINDNEPILHNVRIFRNSGQEKETNLWEAKVGVIVCNSTMYPLVKLLNEMYPLTKFIKANELPQYIDEILSQDV